MREDEAVGGLEVKVDRLLTGTVRRGGERKGGV